MNHPTPNLLYTWPLVIAVEDCYVPESASYVIDAIKDLDLETCGITLKFAALQANWNLTIN